MLVKMQAEAPVQARCETPDSRETLRLKQSAVQVLLRYLVQIVFLSLHH